MISIWRIGAIPNRDLDLGRTDNLKGTTIYTGTRTHAARLAKEAASEAGFGYSPFCAEISHLSTFIAHLEGSTDGMLAEEIHATDKEEAFQIARRFYPFADVTIEAR